jgi:hypothetical protein
LSLLKVTCKLEQARGQKSTKPEEEINKCAGIDWQYKILSPLNVNYFPFLSTNIYIYMEKKKPTRCS